MLKSQVLLLNTRIKVTTQENLSDYVATEVRKDNEEQKVPSPIPMLSREKNPVDFNPKRTNMPVASDATQTPQFSDLPPLPQPKPPIELPPLPKPIPSTSFGYRNEPRDISPIPRIRNRSPIDRRPVTPSPGFPIEKNKSDEFTRDYGPVTIDLANRSPIDRRQVTPSPVFSIQKNQSDGFSRNYGPVTIDIGDETAIFDSNNVFNTKRPTNNVRFISDDPKENQDINDPEWEEVKSLKNDHERRQFAIKSFGNIEPANPSNNLTYHGFRRKYLRRSFNCSSLSPKYNLDTKRVKIQNGSIEIIPLTDGFGSSSGKRKAEFEHEEAPDPKRRMIGAKEFEMRVEQIGVESRRRSFGKKKGDLETYVRHFRQGMMESLSFFKYFDDENNNKVNEYELKKVEAIEELYEKFTSQYGLTSNEICKDCSYQEKRNVSHFF